MDQGWRFKGDESFAVTVLEAISFKQSGTEAANPAAAKHQVYLQRNAEYSLMK